MNEESINYITEAVVCAREINIKIKGNVISEVMFSGGCHGNAQAVGSLVKGMNVEEVVKRLQGINCKGRGTSCADQLAKALLKCR